MKKKITGMELFEKGEQVFAPCVTEPHGSKRDASKKPAARSLLRPHGEIQRRCEAAHGIDCRLFSCLACRKEIL